MGTTATVALVDEEAGTIALAHVGDSRAYRYRDGALEQLTSDHSLVARDGALRPPDRGRGGRPPAPIGDHARARDRARGRGRHARRSTSPRATCFLLCSDGLSAMVRDDEIARRGRGLRTAIRTAAGEELVRAANAAGGDDNVTVVLFELVEGEPVPRVPPRRGRRRRRDEHRDDRPRAHGGDGRRDRHGAGKGSRWPALLFVLALLALTALVLWWSFLR